MKFRKSASIFLGLCLFALPLSGCTQAQQRNAVRSPNLNGPLTNNSMRGTNQNAGTQWNNLIGGTQNMGTGTNPMGTAGIRPNLSGTTGTGTNPRLNPIGQQMGFDMQKADNLTKHLGAMPEIKRVHTVVHGNTALVGYTPANMARDTNTVKNMINTRVKQIDTSIKNVHVSDSSNMMTKMSQLTNDVKSGKPVNDLYTRFTQMIRSIEPSGK